MARIVGTSNSDNIFGTPDADEISGLESNDLLAGLAGNDSLDGGDGNDFLLGEAGDDRLDGGPGADDMFGGVGSDIYEVDNIGDRVQDEDNDPGIDTVRSNVTYTINGPIEFLILTGSDPINGTGSGFGNTLIGNDARNSLNGAGGNDIVTGERGNDGLSGGDGNDRLEGGAGDDFIDGGRGDDRMEGGRGDEQYIVDSSNDRIFEDADEGKDQVEASADFKLPANVEDMHLEFFAGSISGIGNSENNELTGNDSDNTLIGRGGNDVLIGHGGNDTLNGGTGKDLVSGGPGKDTFVLDTLIFRFGSNREIDIIRDFSSRDDILAVSASAFGGGLVADEFLVPGRSFIANGNPAPTTDIGTFLYDTIPVLFTGTSTGPTPAVRFRSLSSTERQGLTPGISISSRFIKGRCRFSNEYRAAALLKAAHSAAVHLCQYLIALFLV